MRVRFTASATDGLWLHIKGSRSAGFLLEKLAPEETSVGRPALTELYEALLASKDYGVSPYFDVPAAAAHVCPKCADGWICEAHPNLPWPHDDCIGPGMPCDEPGCPDSLAGLPPGPEAFKRIADRVVRQGGHVCAAVPGIVAAIDQAEAAARERKEA
jgi:hypothetical protein